MGRTVYKYGFVLFLKLYFIFPVKNRKSIKELFFVEEEMLQSDIPVHT